MWNGFGPPESWARKNAVARRLVREGRRDPEAIERTVQIPSRDVERFQEFLDVGAEHVIVGLGHPFDLAAVQRLLDARDRS